MHNLERRKGLVGEGAVHQIFDVLVRLAVVAQCAMDVGDREEAHDGQCASFRFLHVEINRVHVAACGRVRALEDVGPLDVVCDDGQSI